MKRLLQAIAIFILFWLALPCFGMIANYVNIGGSGPVTPTFGLDSNNVYVTANLLRAYLFDDGAGNYPGSGTTIHDYTGNDDGTASQSDMWTSTGMLFNENDETVSTDMPWTASATTKGSVVMVFTSATGDDDDDGVTPGASEYAKFVCDSLADENFQFYRDESDTGLTTQTNAVWQDYTVPDFWDAATHTLVFTFDADADEVKLYSDGVLRDTGTSAFTLATLGPTLYIGNRAADRPIMGTLSATYIFDIVLDVDDALSLHTYPYQLFNNEASPEPPEPEGDVYYVTQSGTGDGATSSTPMSVAAHNVGSFEPGSTIYLSGTFTTTVSVPSSGTAGNHIIYDGKSAGTCNPTVSACTSMAVLNGTSGQTSFNLNGNDYITIQDFEITTTAANGISNTNLSDDSEVILVRRNSIHGQGVRGVWVKDIDYMTIGGADGDGNIIYGQGITTANGGVGAQAAENLTISYNSIYGNATDEGGDGIVLTSADDVLIEYNKIYDHYQEDGIDVKGGCNRVEIKYNWISNNGQTGVTAQLGATDVDIHHNLIEENGNVGRVTWGGGILVKDNKDDGAKTTDIEIWDNIINENSCYGLHITRDGFEGVDNVWVYNNTFYNNPTRTKAQCTANNWYQFVISATSSYVTDVDVQNNLFLEGKEGESSVERNDQVWIEDTSSLTSFANNTSYIAGLTSQLYNGSTWENFAGALSTASNKDEDPDLTDPANGDFNLDSIVTAGGDLGDTYDEGLRSTTDFSVWPIVVTIGDWDTYGWARGAYVYDE